MEGSALDHSEVYNWLKSLSPGLNLERLTAQFESREFKSRRSLSYVKSEDLDSFFPSPDKLMLAERRVLEAELEKIRTGTVRRSPGLEPRRLSMSQHLDRNVYDSFTAHVNMAGG